MNKFSITTIVKPAQWIIEAASSIGLDFSELSHEVTNYFVNHSLKQHGNEKAEKARGQAAISSADIDRLSDIVKFPDYAIIGKNRSKEILVVYSKRYEDGTLIYYEEVLNSKKNKALRSKTIFKKMGTVSKEAFKKIVANNANTDIMKVVVGAGGNPGGEA